MLNDETGLIVITNNLVRILSRLYNLEYKNNKTIKEWSQDKGSKKNITKRIKYRYEYSDI